MDELNQNQNDLTAVKQTKQYEAVNLQSVAAELDREIGYVDETKSDFAMARTASAIWPIDKIDQLRARLTEARKIANELQIKHAGMILPKKYASGETVEVFLRQTNPEDFNNIVTKHHEATASFNKYLQDHIALLRANPDLVKF